jgi:hypothetical protein
MPDIQLPVVETLEAYRTISPGCFTLEVNRADCQVCSVDICLLVWQIGCFLDKRFLRCLFTCFSFAI